MGQRRLHSKPMTSPWSQAREQLPATWEAWLLYDKKWLFRQVVYEPAQMLRSPEPSLRMVDESPSPIISLLGPRCPPFVMANLYGLHCTFGCIIDINQISDCLQKRTMSTLNHANFSIVSWQTGSIVIKIARISEVDNFALDQCGLRTTPCRIIRI